MLHLLRRRPPATSFPSFEQPPRRAVFYYFDGTTKRVADPIATLRALQASEANLERDPKAADEGDMDAIARLVSATRSAFGVSPYEERDGHKSGLTDGECLALLNSYSNYLDALKKNTEPPAT
ncbi:MAG: hypothetical protein AB7U73_01320 [Pirellulales bacterium]